MRDKGITDQFVEPNRTTTFNLPTDAFAHTRPEAVLTVTAQQTNGQPLPNWVLFNAQAGAFLVTPPPGFTGELEVQVIVRDTDGREPEAAHVGRTAQCDEDDLGFEGERLAVGFVDCKVVLGNELDKRLTPDQRAKNCDCVSGFNFSVFGLKLTCIDQCFY
jgi:hypothetical protein